MVIIVLAQPLLFNIAMVSPIRFSPGVPDIPDSPRSSSPTPPLQAESSGQPAAGAGTSAIYRHGAGAAMRDAVHSQLAAGQAESSLASASLVADLNKKEINNFKLSDLPVLRQEMAKLAATWDKTKVSKSPEEQQAAQEQAQKQLDATADLIERLDTLQKETLEDVTANPRTFKETFTAKMHELSAHIFDLGDDDVIQQPIYELAMKDCAVLDLHFKDRALDANFDYEGGVGSHLRARIEWSQPIPSSDIAHPAPVRWGPTLPWHERTSIPHEISQFITALNGATSEEERSGIAARFDHLIPDDLRTPRPPPPDDGRISLEDVEALLAADGRAG